MSRGGAPDVDAAPLLASAVANELVSSDGTSARRLLPQIRELLSKCCERAPDQPGAWETCLYLERKCGGLTEQRAALVGRISALRMSTQWKTEGPALDELAEATAQQVELEFEDNDATRLVGMQKEVAKLLHDAEEHNAATQGAESLRMLAMRLNRHIDDL